MTSTTWRITRSGATCAPTAGAFMVQFLVAVVVLLPCAPCTIAIAVAVLKLSGDNWADWSAAPVS